MKKLILILVFVSIFAQETTHTVKTGDTLWDIAGFYFQNPFLWPYIWRANLTKIEDPHWIYPDQVFVIPPSPEAIGEVVPPPIPTESIPPIPIPEEVVPPPPPPPPKKKAAEIISVVKPEERIFSEEIIHRAGFIVIEDLPYWGEIIGTEPADEKNITTFEKIYINRVQDLREDDILTIYRPGKEIKHPKTGKGLGKEIIVLGKAEVSEIGKEGSRCKVIASYDIIKRGDFVTPYEPIVAPEKVSLVPATQELQGYVVDLKTPGSFTTPPNIFVYIDQGEDSGVVIGDIFEVYQNRVIGGKEMPDYTIAKVQVLSIFKSISIGLLLWNLETVNVQKGEKCRLSMEVR